MLIRRRDVPQIDVSLDYLPPVLQRIVAARGIAHASLLDLRLQGMLPVATLTDIDKAVERLYVALQAQQRIVVIGDFDADGATSTTLVVSALRAMGASQVSFLVPNRFAFGYGLTPGIVELAARDTPDLIITVDNGISSFDGVLAANAAGIDVIITDHHLPLESLPKACAIVNPNQAGDRFESKSIAGVGVIFYVMLALRQHLRARDWFLHRAEPNMAQYLDLVALGTVADVVPLDQNNRILVSQGLARIRQGTCRPGILALLQVALRAPESLREMDLGFAIAPRLNAAGRLDDMSLGIQCLLANTLAEALPLAHQLDELNRERRSIEVDMSEQALQVLSRLSLPGEGNLSRLPVALCLFDASWHQGVIGILAGRLKDKYHRPTVVFACGNGDEIKGSARSVPNVNIRDVLAAIDRDNPGLMDKFGGHAMAAGLSMPAHAFSAFQGAFIAEVGKHWDLARCQGELLSDGPLSPAELTLEFAMQVQAQGPWGQQFPEPLFDNRFEVLEQRTVGQHHLKLTLRHELGGECVDAIAFNVNAAEWPNHRARWVHAAYRLDINHYRGRRTLQLILVSMQTVQAQELVFS